MAKQQKPSELDKQLHMASQRIKAGDAKGVLLGLMELTKKHPKDPRVLDLLCSAHATLGRHAEAIDAGKRAVAIDLENPNTRIRYAMALQAGGEYEEALNEYERALYRAPGNLHILRSKLGLFTDLGDHKRALEALEVIDKVVKKTTPPPHEIISIALNKARLSPKTLPAQPVIDELLPMAKDESFPNAFRVSAYHHLGRLSETTKDYDNAIQHFISGNNIDKPEWKPDAFSAYITKLINCWKGASKVPNANVTIKGPKLIFIVGMMRSGTSLTEQMISQLPSVTPGGEMNAVARSVIPFESVPSPWGAQPFPVSRLIYNQRVINKIAQSAATYYTDVAKEGIVTDKQPYNTFYVPLIARLFPDAKIIHCCRDPQDTCLSNFMQTYARPHPYTHDLSWLGRYSADYLRMMAEWHKLPEVNMLDVQYEDTVSDPEAQSKRICEFLEIPWTEDILDFHNSSRTVRTASRDQVRKPIYKSSVFKHEHYTQHLAPLRQGIGIED